MTSSLIQCECGASIARFYTFFDAACKAHVKQMLPNQEEYDMEKLNISNRLPNWKVIFDALGPEVMLSCCKTHIMTKINFNTSYTG